MTHLQPMKTDLISFKETSRKEELSFCWVCQVCTMRAEAPEESLPGGMTTQTEQCQTAEKEDTRDLVLGTVFEPLRLAVPELDFCIYVRVPEILFGLSQLQLSLCFLGEKR